MAVMTTNADDVRVSVLQWPDLTALDPMWIRVRYIEPLDTLFVDLLGEPLPAVWVPLTVEGYGIPYAGMRLASDNEDLGEVIGIMIEDYRADAIHEHPTWKLFDAMIGVTDRHAVNHARLLRLIAEIGALPPADTDTPDYFSADSVAAEVSPTAIRALRQRLDLSQSAFAHRVHAHPQTVSKWERGLLRPTGAHVFHLARMLAAQPDVVPPAERHDGVAT